MTDQTTKTKPEEKKKTDFPKVMAAERQMIQHFLARSCVKDYLGEYFMMHGQMMMSAAVQGKPLQDVYGENWPQVQQEIHRIYEQVSTMKFYLDGLENKDLDRNDLQDRRAILARQAYDQIPFFCPSVYKVLHILLEKTGVGNLSISPEYFDEQRKRRMINFDTPQDDGYEN